MPSILMKKWKNRRLGQYKVSEKTEMVIDLRICCVSFYNLAKQNNDNDKSYKIV